MTKVRIEQDSMGGVEVPADCLYGASTQRAVMNFPISGIAMPRTVIHALATIKIAAARANRDLGLLPGHLARLIETAADEIRTGHLDAHFPVDVFQTGSGTSTNMNLNEVIANRAAQLAGAEIGQKTPVHPNDHVNLGQSSNDAFPSAVHVAAAQGVLGHLLPALITLGDALAEKANAWRTVVKIGRTHLQDATPITLGQEFSGYARQIRLAHARALASVDGLKELALGGTAVGTGLNAHPEFAKRACAELMRITDIEFVEAVNHFEAQGARDALVFLSGALTSVAISLSRIANDIRMLGSGPRCGFGELILPAIQPGSSIMPGKVNPVICEAVIQVAIQVVGNGSAITLAGFGGVGSVLDLNLAMPVMARNVIESITLLANAASVLEKKCIRGLQADEEHCAAMIERSLAMCTSLAPVIGYDRAAALAKRAHAENRTIREIAMEEKLLPEGELQQLLDPRTMLSPRAGRGGE